MMNDIFNQDAFTLTSLTAAINEVPYTPSLIGSLGLFEEDGIATLDATIEYEKGVISLVPVLPRGAPGTSVTSDKRKVNAVKVPHLPETGTLLADTVQGVREFGTESSPRSVERARDALLAKMRRQMDYTIEAHRLSAIKGAFYDANGQQVDLYAYLGVTLPTPVNFLLTTQTTKVRQKCLDVIETIEAGLDGVPYTGIEAICGKNFWREFIEHPLVKESYLATQQAAALRGSPVNSLVHGDITFRRYRGNSAVKVGDDEAWAFPRGVPEMFLTRFAPANYIETVNTLGLPYYAKAEPMKMGKGYEMEAQSNPLNFITRPAGVVRLLKSA